MDKSILDIVNDFKQWKGNTYALAALIAAQQKELDRAALINAGFAEAAEAVI